MKILRPGVGRKRNGREVAFLTPNESQPGKFYISRLAAELIGDYVIVYELEPDASGKRRFALRSANPNDEGVRKLSTTGSNGKYRTLSVSAMRLEGRHYLQRDEENDLWILTPEQPAMN